MAKIIDIRTRIVLADLPCEPVAKHPKPLFSNEPDNLITTYLEACGTCACFEGYVCAKHRGIAL